MTKILDTFLIRNYSLTGQSQQVVTQIIRGQPVSTAVSSTSTASTSSGQKTVTSPGTPPQQIQPQTASQPPRPQQGQVKLTMAQLTQLTQGQVKIASECENMLMLDKLSQIFLFQTCSLSSCRLMFLVLLLVNSRNRYSILASF